MTDGAPRPPSPSAAAPPEPPRVPINLLQPSQRRRPSKSTKVFRAVRSAFRSFPILPPACRLPAGIHILPHDHAGTRMTGTLFGNRMGRATLAVQESPRSLPILTLELPIATGKLLQEMGTGLVRISLECEKKAADRSLLLDEPSWTTFCNGRKLGYSSRREPAEADLAVMQLLHAVSMGAGVLPGGGAEDSADGELTYMRAHFDRVIGSRDSETFYMLNPDGNSGPELTVFFVRI